MKADKEAKQVVVLSAMCLLGSGLHAEVSIKFTQRIFLFTVLVSITISAVAKKKEVPKSPFQPSFNRQRLPSLPMAEVPPLAFDEFYSQIKQWNRFKLTSAPSEADIVIELKYVVEDKGQHTGSTYNSYTKQTQVYSYQVTDPQLILNIYDSKSHDLLWSTTDHRRLARREKNQEKETITSADRLVKELQERMAIQGPEDK